MELQTSLLFHPFLLILSHHQMHSCFLWPLLIHQLHAHQLKRELVIMYHFYYLWVLFGFLHRSVYILYACSVWYSLNVSIASHSANHAVLDSLIAICIRRACLLLQRPDFMALYCHGKSIFFWYLALIRAPCTYYDMVPRLYELLQHFQNLYRFGMSLLCVLPVLLQFCTASER